MKKVPAKATEIGLVLQGGGALGAYEYGAITALLELIDEAAGKGHAVSLKAVTGVSIGAINAACVVGAATRTDARRRLASLWNDLVLETPMFWPRQARRDLALYGLPNFYSMRADVLSFSRWTHVYDTRPLLPTLTRHVDFAELNASDTAFVVTAVDVESGVLKRFSNKKLDKAERTIIDPQHVLASGSLPPQFPWTEIKEGKDSRRYWDGGIVDNTPLTDAIDAFSVDKDVRRLLVVMNLFPQAAPLPTTLFEVTERVDELRFGNRMHQDTKTADRINMLAATIDALADLVPSELPPELALNVAKARALRPARSTAFAIFRAEASKVAALPAGPSRFRRYAPSSTGFDVARTGARSFSRGQGSAEELLQASEERSGTGRRQLLRASAGTGWCDPPPCRSCARDGSAGGRRAIALSTHRPEFDQL